MKTKIERRKMNTEIAVSIVLPVHNAEMYIRDSIDSIICQSFKDFECIIVDDGSTDNTCNIIRSYDDKRIIMIENCHDFVSSLNLGISKAQGKYIARMDADDKMHPDRLKIQHAIMETEPSITVCSTWMKQFWKNVPVERIAHSLCSLVKYPLLAFLQGNFVFHPTVMIRKKFLIENKLHYENYPYAEDYKLWIEIAKKGGIFYVESQPLLYYRISETQITQKKREEQIKTSEKILLEVLYYLIEKNKNDFPELMLIFEALDKLREKEMVPFNGLVEVFQKIFHLNKSRLLSP